MSQKYLVRFYGRRLGAIGTPGWHQVLVDAASPHDAHMRAYETHEHLSNVTVLPQLTEGLDAPHE